MVKALPAWLKRKLARSAQLVHLASLEGQAHRVSPASPDSLAHPHLAVVLPHRARLDLKARPDSRASLEGLVNPDSLDNPEWHRK